MQSVLVISWWTYQSKLTSILLEWCRLWLSEICLFIFQSDLKTFPVFAQNPLVFILFYSNTTENVLLSIKIKFKCSLLMTYFQLIDKCYLIYFRSWSHICVHLLMYMNSMHKCMRACVWECLSACVYVSRCVWRPEVDTGCLFLLISILYIETGSLAEPGTCYLG